jgi:hypothetical protein
MRVSAANALALIQYSHSEVTADATRSSKIKS